MFPMGIILEGKKAWIKGNPTDTSIKESFKTKYGEVAHKWLETIKLTVNNFDPIDQMYGRVQDANAEQQYIGITATQANINEGVPTVTMMNVNSGAAYANDHATICQRMGPYKTDPVAAATYNSNVGVGAFECISSNIASAITDKEDRKDAARIKTGEINNLSYFIAGDIDLDSGKINSVILSERTQGHIDAMAKPKEEMITIPTTKLAPRSLGSGVFSCIVRYWRISICTNNVMLDIDSHFVLSMTFN